MKSKSLVSAMLVAMGALLPTMAHAAEPKPRIIVLTDIAPIAIEPDDMESMIRLMAHADLFEVEGLVATTGWSDGGNQEHPEIICNVIDAYEKDVPNLKKRSGQDGFQADESHQSIGYWPSPDYLRSKTVVGSKKRGMQFVGAENDSAGSELIIKAADEKDDRPLYVGVWGGANTLAQAIWRVKQDRTPEQLQTFLHKIRVYTITDQDRPQNQTGWNISSHYWMRKEFSKDLQFVWDESAWNYQNNTGKSNWTNYAEQIQGKGALGAIYPKYKYGVEGDTPSYLYVMPNGLNDPEHPTYGGWGAIFEFGVTRDKETSSWNNHAGTTANTASKKYQPKFYPAEFNNFVARMNWAKDGTGNRNPIVAINGDTTLASVTLSPKAGTALTIDASATRDPEGDALTYSWWVFTEAGTYDKEMTLTGADTSRATLPVPADAAGKAIHVICEVTDNGTPPLSAYRRVIVEPSGK